MSVGKLMRSRLFSEDALLVFLVNNVGVLLVLAGSHSHPLESGQPCKNGVYDPRQDFLSGGAKI